MLWWHQAIGSNPRQAQEEGGINQGDIILVGLRDYQDAKADVILKYNADEARKLKTYGEFPDSIKVTDTAGSVYGRSIEPMSSFKNRKKSILFTDFDMNIILLLRKLWGTNFVDDGLDDDIKFGDESGDECYC